MLIAFPSVLNDGSFQRLCDYFRSQNLDFQTARLFDQTIFICHRQPDAFQVEAIRNINPGFLIHRVKRSFPLASAEWRESRTIVDARGQKIGEADLRIMGGPCAVESEEQLFSIAEFLHSRGIKFLRGGAYKPRTSPYSFQGLKKEGLQILKKVANHFDMRVVTEIMDLSLLEEVYDVADILQVGTRNMYNYQLLKELGKLDKPVMLKRAFSGRIEEWLLAAEYLLLGGNEKVILCERGIRTFETETRNTLDIAAIPLVRELSHLPVIADPSQGTGDSSLVIPVSLAAVAAGVDGIMLEVHNQPDKALSDGPQSLMFSQFDNLLAALINTFNSNKQSFDFARKSVNFTPVN